MRFLHTADVHLSVTAPERLDAFKAVCQMAQDLDCKALVVAGDLFDTPQSALDLRAEIRELFDSLEQDVFLIPGNHDAAAFRSGEYYGKHVHTTGGDESARWEVEGVPLIGIPYLPGRQGVESLRSMALREQSPLIALMHTNFYNSSMAALYFPQEEDNQTAACLWDRDLDDLPPTYIALGHWHNPTIPPVVVNNVQVAYSGTPYPTAKGEIGARCAVLIEVSSEGITLKGVEIPGVPRRETASFFFVPGGEEQTLEEMRSFLNDQASTQVILDLEVDGWVEKISEEACVGEIQAMVKRYCDRWKAVKTGTLHLTGMSSLPGFALRCLQFLGDSEAPDPSILDSCTDPLLRELAQEVLGEPDQVYRTALSHILRQMGRGR